MPVIPATQEAEAGESLEPRRQKLQRAEIMPLYSSLGDRARLRIKQTNKQKHSVKLSLALEFQNLVLTRLYPQSGFIYTKSTLSPDLEWGVDLARLHKNAVVQKQFLLLLPVFLF